MEPPTGMRARVGKIAPGKTRSLTGASIEPHQLFFYFLNRGLYGFRHRRNTFMHEPDERTTIYRHGHRRKLDGISYPLGPISEGDLSRRRP